MLSRKDGHCDPSVFIQNNGLFYKSVPNPVHDEGAQGDPTTRTRMQMRKMRPFLFSRQFSFFYQYNRGIAEKIWNICTFQLFLNY